MLDFFEESNFFNRWDSFKIYLQKNMLSEDIGNGFYVSRKNYVHCFAEYFNVNKFFTRSLMSLLQDQGYITIINKKSIKINYLLEKNLK